MFTNYREVDRERNELKKQLAEERYREARVVYIQDAELIAKHAAAETGEYAVQLKETAENPLLWPDQELLSQVSLGRNLTTDEESKAWHATFDPIWEQ